MKKFSIVLCILLLSINSSCVDEIVPPNGDDGCVSPPGNRSFSWSMDTVAWFPSTLGGVWAFSDDDAYVMGYLVTKDSPATVILGLHWNGAQWEENINGTVEEIKHVANDVIGDDHYMVSVGNWSINPPKPGIGEFDNLTKKWQGYQFETQGELRNVWTDGKGYFIAVGDNGMVYTKDGYAAQWIYSQAPTNFHFTRIAGVSKTEMYARAGVALAGGEHYQQIWRYSEDVWTKLMDNQDTTDLPIQLPEAENNVNDLAVYRCQVTDTLSLYIVGQESFQISSEGQSLVFTKENLSHKGLPLSISGLPPGIINFFSPSDYWISSLRYHWYHWNGSNFQKIEPIQSLPYGQLWGATWRGMQGETGKTWMILETDSQVYTILQGIPD